MLVTGLSCSFLTLASSCLNQGDQCVLNFKLDVIIGIVESVHIESYWCLQVFSVYPICMKDLIDVISILYRCFLIVFTLQMTVLLCLGPACCHVRYMFLLSLYICFIVKFLSLRQGLTLLLYKAY